MKENTYTLADVKRMQSPINKRNKKIEIEKRNLEASIKIRAHNKIMEASKKKEIDDLRESVKQQLASGHIPLDAYVEVYNNRIKVLTDRVEALKIRKESNGGVLTAGAENQLKLYESDLEKVLQEKKDFLAQKEDEFEKIKKEQEEFLKRKEEEKKLEEAKREAAKKLVEDANYGRQKMLEDAKREVMAEEIERKIEAARRGLPPKE